MQRADLGEFAGVPSHSLTFISFLLSSLPQIFGVPHKISAALEWPQNQSLKLSCSRRVCFPLAIMVLSAFDVTTCSVPCLSERLSGGDPSWTGTTGICGIVLMHSPFPAVHPGTASQAALLGISSLCSQKSRSSPDCISQ